jgi:hypothetical protein
MSSVARLSFRGITRAVFALLQIKARKNGMSVNKPAGETLKDGIKIRWNYQPDAELLEIECVSDPFWIDAARVSRKLTREIEDALHSESEAA